MPEITYLESSDDTEALAARLSEPVRRWCLDKFPDFTAIYISPIKALANDIERNLLGPLEEIKARYLPDRAKEIRVGLRTGDTSQSDRQKMLRKPPHILITTPESMAIAVGSSRFQPIVSRVKWMIIDELHSTAWSRPSVGCTSASPCPSSTPC